MKRLSQLKISKSVVGLLIQALLYVSSLIFVLAAGGPGGPMQSLWIVSVTIIYAISAFFLIDQVFTKLFKVGKLQRLQKIIQYIGQL